MNQDFIAGKISLLEYLLGIATEERSELWRALFAEMLYSLKNPPCECKKGDTK